MTQSPPPPPPAPSSGWFVDLIKALFAYIDRPWKAIVVIALLIVGGFGWAAYQERETLFAAWLAPSTPELKTELIPEALEKLSYETSADLVSIWQVDLSSNSQTFIAAKQRQGVYEAISPRRLPVFVTASDIKSLLSVIEGHPACLTLTDGSPIVRRLIARGMARACAIPIPANPEAFFGVIYLSWKTAPDETAESVAVSNARRIAATLWVH